MITITSKATVRLSAKLRREMGQEISEISTLVEQAKAHLARVTELLARLGYEPCISCGTFFHTSEMELYGHSDAGTDYICKQCEQRCLEWEHGGVEVAD